MQAVERLAEQVAPEVVRSEVVMPGEGRRARLVDVREIDLVLRIGREPPAEEADGEDRDEARERQDAERAADEDARRP